MKYKIGFTFNLRENKKDYAKRVALATWDSESEEESKFVYITVFNPTTKEISRRAQVYIDALNYFDLGHLPNSELELQTLVQGFLKADAIKCLPRGAKVDPNMRIKVGQLDAKIVETYSPYLEFN